VLQILALVVRGQAEDSASIAVSSRDASDVATQRPSSRTSSTSSPISRRSSTRSRSRSSRTGGPRGASGVGRAHRGARAGGRAKELPGDRERRSRTRSSRSSRTARCTRSRSGAVSCRGRRRVPAAAGVGPKTAARIWTQLGITSLDGLKARRRGGRLRDLSGMGAKSEEKILKALEAGVGGQPEERRLLGQGSRPCGASSRSSRASRRDRGLRSGQRRRRARRSRPRPHRDVERSPALIAAFCEGDWVSEVARGETRRRRSSATTASRFDLASSRTSATATCFSTSRGPKDHNIALREDAQRRGLSISEYGVTDVESGDVVTHASEDELYAFLGYSPIRPSCEEGTAEIAAARAGTLPDARRAGRTCEGRCTATRRGRRRKEFARGDGPHCEVARVSLPLHHRHSHYLRDGRLEAQWR
jgi:hypothetical protein